MAIKELQTRIALKYDSYANWTDDTQAGLGANLILLKGEIGICEIPTGNSEAQTAPTVLFKVGDGTNPFKNLKWASALAADVYGWAKASTVELVGKKLVFVGGGKDGANFEVAINYATPEEVAAAVKVVSDKLDGVDARVVALEGKFTGESSVDAKIATAKQEAIDAAASDASTKAGTAETNAKAYTDTRETAITAAYEAYADQAEADAKAYADEIAEEQAKTDSAQDALIAANDAAIKKEASDRATAVSNAITEVKAYADTAESDAVATAKNYTDTREAAIKTAYEAYADQAEADAKTYVDGKVSTINAKDADQDTEIGKKLDKTTYEAYIADKEMSDEALKGYADGVAATAKSEAVAAAKTETESQISTLVTSGQVKTNTDAIAQNKADIAAMDTAYKKAVSDEAKAREDADKALSDRIDSIDAFFAAADHDGEEGGLNDALDTLKEIQDYLNGEGSATNGMLGRLAQAETDIDNLEKEFNTDTGRVKVAEGKITALEAKDAELESADTALGQRIDALVGENGTIATGDAATLEAAKGYTDDRETTIRSELKTAYEAYADGKASAAETAAKGHADTAVAGLKTTLEAADAAIEAEVDKKLAAETFNTWKGTHEADHAGTATAISAEIDADVAAEAALREAADTALTNKIGTIDGTVAEAIAGVKTTAETAVSDLAALTTRVGTAEGNITAIQAIVSTGDDANSKLRAAITTLQELTGDASKGNVKLRSDLDELAGKVNHATTGLAATKAIADEAKSDAEDAQSRVAAIEADYLKKADLFIFQCGTATTVDHKAEA